MKNENKEIKTELKQENIEIKSENKEIKTELKQENKEIKEINKEVKNEIKQDNKEIKQERKNEIKKNENSEKNLEKKEQNIENKESKEIKKQTKEEETEITTTPKKEENVNKDESLKKEKTKNENQENNNSEEESNSQETNQHVQSEPNELERNRQIIENYHFERNNHNRPHSQSFNGTRTSLRQEQIIQPQNPIFIQTNLGYNLSSSSSELPFIQRIITSYTVNDRIVGPSSHIAQLISNQNLFPKVNLQVPGLLSPGEVMMMTGYTPYSEPNFDIYVHTIISNPRNNDNNNNQNNNNNNQNSNNLNSNNNQNNNNSQNNNNNLNNNSNQKEFLEKGVQTEEIKEKTIEDK